MIFVERAVELEASAKREQERLWFYLRPVDLRTLIDSKVILTYNTSPLTVSGTRRSATSNLFDTTRANWKDRNAKARMSKKQCFESKSLFTKTKSDVSLHSMPNLYDFVPVIESNLHPLCI
jgi:hypothetical protein